MTHETPDPFMAFEEACADHDIQLADTLYSGMARICNRDGEVLFCPSSLQKAIASAGRAVRKQFDGSLASEPIPPLSTTDPIGINTLRQLINVTVTSDPIDDTMPTPEINRPFAAAIGACDDAEPRYAMTFRGITEAEPFERPLAPHCGYEVFTDELHGPLFLRKARGDASAINLQQVRMNDVTYPVGAIFRLDAWEDSRENGNKPFVAPNAAVQRSAADITNMSFLRLSGFSYPSKPRHDFVQNEVYWEDNSLSQSFYEFSQSIVEEVRQALEARMAELPDGLELRTAID